MSTPRVPTGIAGLDEMLAGGFLPGTANLVEGAPGTGKSTLAMQFIEHGITACDEPGIILTFEEFPEHLIRDAANFGWDFAAHQAAGRPVSYTHLRAHETVLDLVCRLLLEKKKFHSSIQPILT